MSGNGQPVWTVSLISARSSRPSEIKKRDYFERKDGEEVVESVAESAADPDQSGLV
jgi:hypothetical protein